MGRGPGGFAGPAGAARRPGPRLPCRRGERGAVTAEAALVLPTLVLVAVALVWVVSLVGLRLQAVDAAREAARLVARGEAAAVVTGAARAAAPRASLVETSVEGDRVRVRVEVPVLAGLPAGPLRSILARAAGLTVAAESVATLEPVP